MSYAGTLRSHRGNCAAWTAYVVLGTDGTDRADVWVSDLGDPASFVEAVDGYMDGTRRTCDGLQGVLSFTRSEMDPDDPTSPQRAAEVAYELCKRISPDAPVGLAVHTDGEKGFVHVHWFIVNHDLSTGRAVRDNWNHWRVRGENDRLMRERDLEVCPRLDRAHVNPHELRRDPNDLDATDLSSKAEVCDYLAESVDALLDLDEIVTVDDLVRVAPTYGISVRVKPDKGRGHSLTFADVDDDGRVTTNIITTDAGKSRKLHVTATQTKLGSAYTYQAIGQRLAAKQATKQMEEQQNHALEQAQETEASDAVEHPGTVTGTDTPEPDSRPSGVSRSTGEPDAGPGPRAKRRPDPEPAAGHARATGGRNSGDRDADDDRDADGISPHIRRLYARLLREYRQREEKRAQAARTEFFAREKARLAAEVAALDSRANNPTPGYGG